MRFLHRGCVKKNSLDYLNSLMEGEYLLFDGLIPQGEGLVFSKRRPIAGPDRNIILNLNQCTRPDINAEIRGLLDRGYMVVDYSESNILVCGSHENHIHLPYQIKKRERDILSSMMRCEKTHDLGFVGSKSPRRQWAIDALERAGLKILVIDDRFGHGRDAEIAKCKALLNVHYDPHCMVFESLRCDRWSLSGMAVLTELSAFDLYGGTEDILFLSDYKDLPERAIEMVKGYECVRESNSERFRAIADSVIRERRDTLSLSNKKIDLWGR